MIGCSLEKKKKAGRCSSVISKTAVSFFFVFFYRGSAILATHSLSLSSVHRPDMTAILLKKDVKSQIIHPSNTDLVCDEIF